jgi:hypothetical protein
MGGVASLCLIDMADQGHASYQCSFDVAGSDVSPTSRLAANMLKMALP